MLERAFVILLGFALASVYGIGTTLWYGPEHLLAKPPHVESIFWALAGSGVALLLLLDIVNALRTLVHRVAYALFRKRSRYPG